MFFAYQKLNSFNSIDLPGLDRSNKLNYLITVQRKAFFSEF